MGVFGGPNVSEDGLVLALDVANQKCISPLGCTGFNNAPQLVKNIISQLDTINSYNGVKLGNLNYYTVFAIDYPEGSYGGDGASRQGITPGYNVRSGGKTYDASRALHLWVWNNDTNAWVPDNYFRGFRLSGHCYDNYSGAENGYNTELQYFAEDFNTINNTFRNCTYIVMGSHRADRYNSTVRNILTDLGKPSGYIDSDYVAAPEWILVGKPGLGAGNAYGWVYENYSTNPNQVAHLNFGLPIYGNAGNYLEFDGSDDYISISSLSNYNFGSSLSVFVWNYNVGGDYRGLINNGYFDGSGFELRYGRENYFGGSNNGTALYVKLNTSSGTNSVTINSELNVWGYYGFVYNGSQLIAYKNGSQFASVSLTGNVTVRSNPVIIGWDSLNSQYLSGRVSNCSIYNRALSAAEITQNFNATRSRYGI